ncbi:hypothetical protein [Rhodopseudomonas palustris]|uniref:Cap15 family cyclic dinucleotide receptor domain-containing protein n=1 Tax=Rhodopseudomonas palustris TaxID=1076 RepID=UPI0021F2D6D5|nr:hypothetical protein [Rhodopseudomonas palustris]UYO55179.1 hypothetical protein KQX61_07190 [Rhodopseudomonas palustris]
MQHLVRFESLLRGVVFLTVALSLLAFYLLDSVSPNQPVYRLLFISSAITSVLLIVLLSPACFRIALRVFGRFNRVVWADLNGTWEGVITTSDGAELEVRAVVRQSLLKTEIDVHGETVKSITLAAATKMEAGQYKLYYVYRAEPKEPKWAPYSGTTKFDLNVLSSAKLCLSGQYYTDRDTTGTISLRRTGSDPFKHVAYY